MKNIILKILLFILYSSIGLVLAWLSERLSSNFLEKFYKSNFLALLISLTALLFAIYSLITNRLLELAKKSKYAFETTQSELKLAFIILVFCLIISIPLLLLFSIDENTETWIKLRSVIFSALNTILILILHIIIDMGKSVFLITNALSKIEENSQKQ